MANTLLTPTQVTRKALVILHQKATFIGSINRQYDDSFGNNGAKIGDTLKIRLPNQYTVRTGTVMNTQDFTETSVSLQIATMKGVDLNFSDVDLALSLDDFSDRILDPAMSVLAANIESDALNMTLDIYNQVNNVGAAATYAKIVGARKILVDNLAPPGNRSCLLNTQDNVDMLDALKGLFQRDTTIAKQNTEGLLGRTGGMDFYENTLLTPFTPGSEVAAGSSTIQVNGAGQTGSTLTVSNSSSKTLLKGDIFTMVGCNRVHPESKVDTGIAQQFVVTANLASNGTALSISPAIVTTGATQNVSASPTTANAIKKIGTASTAYGMSLAYHKDAFTFATADLVMPKGVHFAARQVIDGISMRIWQQGDITNGKFPCRLDVLYGYKTLRPQLACRIANN